jgi:hypothetical protein
VPVGLMGGRSAVCLRHRQQAKGPSFIEGLYALIIGLPGQKVGIGDLAEQAITLVGARHAVPPTQEFGKLIRKRGS